MAVTREQIEVLAEAWPWDVDDVDRAIMLAEEEGWPLDDTVRALDVLAADFPDNSDPVQTVRAAIEYKREHPRRRP